MDAAKEETEKNKKQKTAETYFVICRINKNNL